MTQVSADYDPSAPFGKYRTFAISSNQVFNQGQPDTGDQFLRDRVTAALSAELASKGLQPAQQKPRPGREGHDADGHVSADPV
jgi:hypothetical protein